ncbi:LCP family protein [Tyzzerella sp. OttesenSCG-928-J15]|nr:LCP family protein [Tyzzerella sp. OttesenSCG-928-J15]
MEREERPNRKRSGIKIFFRTLLISMAVFAGVFAVVIAGLSMFDGNGEGVDENNETVQKKESSETGTKKSGGFFSNIMGTSKKEKVYGLIVGVDNDKTHSDTMILACFDPETVEVTLLSLPRDSRVTMPDEQIEILKEKGAYVPPSGTCKLTEVHHYAYLADKDLAVDFLRAQIKDLLDVDVDFYAKVDFEALYYLVEQIGGVEFDVPVRMYYYDPTQNLTIDLQPGVQTLNGDKAEQLVRYRSYPGGDFMRMEVQQEFVKAFVKQALSKESIVKNIPSFAAAAIKYVETDFNIADIPGYLKYLDDFSADKIYSYALPVSGTPTIDGKSYVILDEEGCKELVDDIFFGKTVVEEQSSENLRIQVLNGAGVTGLAKSGKELLENNGFTVASIGDYSGVRADNNRIFVSQRGMGADIKKILKNSDIVFDPTLDSNYDIVVVIGKLGLD